MNPSSFPNGLRDFNQATRWLPATPWEEPPTRSGSFVLPGRAVQVRASTADDDGAERRRPDDLCAAAHRNAARPIKGAKKAGAASVVQQRADEEEEARAPETLL